LLHAAAIVTKDLPEAHRAMTPPSPDNTAVVPTPSPAKRDVDTVPFVELFDNRVQGVVSASSDPNRVYCAFLEAGTGNYYSSTNNNRPDAGMPKRMNWLLEEAARQFGLERLARYLQVPADPASVTHHSQLIGLLMRRGACLPEPAGTVFSRFLGYLRHVELPSGVGPLPEMSWFVAG
jgi:hypothetical protein